MTKTAIQPSIAIRPVKDRLLDSLTTSFRDYLVETNHNDEATVAKWIEQAHAFAERRRPLLLHLNDDDNGNCISDLVQQALQQALKQLPSLKRNIASPATAASLSMSLFASDFTLPPILDVDLLQAALPLEQVQILQQFHLDDIIHDWELIIAPILQHTLLADSSAAAASLELQRKWLDDSKSHMDSSSLVQSTICQNLLKLLQKNGSDNDASHAAMMTDQVLPMSWSLWMDWMTSTSNSSIALEVRSLALTLISWHVDPSHATLLQGWIQLDPYGLWMQAWMAVSPEAVEAVSATFIKSIWKGAMTTGKDRRQVCTYYLSLLRSLLVAMRVSRFPWKEVCASDKPEEAVLRHVLDTYVGYLKITAAAAAAAAAVDKEQAMALDAIDTILCGCRHSYDAVYRDFVREVMMTSEANELMRHLVDR